ncbi:hypothetical protein ACLOAV_010403 [Pseudogymnoascus australis]
MSVDGSVDVRRQCQGDARVTLTLASILTLPSNPDTAVNAVNPDTGVLTLLIDASIDASVMTPVWLTPGSVRTVRPSVRVVTSAGPVSGA